MTWTLVTGSAKRLGAEICRELAKSGHNIVVHYLSSESLAGQLVHEIKQNGGQAEMIQGDFSTLESVDDFIERYRLRFSQTGYLVNNVGRYFVGSALNTPQDEWQKLYQVNVFSPMAIMKALVPAIRRNQGAMINIGTAGMTNFRAETYASAYHLSKYSLYLLTQSLAKELACDGVRVNMVSPGILENSVDTADRPVPMGRFGTIRELAQMVRIVLSGDHPYMTGQNIEVAGGYKL